MKAHHYLLIIFLGATLLFAKHVDAASLEIVSPIEGAIISPSDLVEIKWRESEPSKELIIRLCSADLEDCIDIAAGDPPQINKDGTNSFYYYNGGFFYNSGNFSTNTDKVILVKSAEYNGVSDQVRVTFLAGNSIKAPQSVKDATLNLLPFDSDSNVFTDVIPIKWEQKNLSQPVNIIIKNESGGQVGSFHGTSIDDGLQTFDLKVDSSLLRRDGTKYKVYINAKYKFIGIREGSLSDQGNEYFTVAEKNLSKEFYKINDIKVNKQSFFKNDPGFITWSSECKAPFVDLMLVKENISGKEDFIYLTRWSEGHAQYPNSSFTKNTGSLSFNIPNSFSFKFANKSYSFNYRPVDGAITTSIGNEDIASLDSGTYRIRVVVHKYGPSQILWPEGRLEDMSSYPSCTGTGLSDPFYIGQENINEIKETTGKLEPTSSSNIEKINITNQGMYNNLKGRILLQVERAGEAYYVHPNKLEKYYLGRPDDAFSVMREQGIGISNANLLKIPVADTAALKNTFQGVDTDGDGYDDYTELLNGYNPLGSGSLSYDLNFAKAQAGKIFLQVEKNGEAWYINPVDNKRYFLGRPADAFSIMRNLGLGVSNSNFEKLK